MRYLTKSRFKLALECPTKLFYTRKKEEYEDTSQADDFLMALAEGGFQVGELAKCYYPGGRDITTLDYQEALDQTNEELAKTNCIIYEAAFAYETCFSPKSIPCTFDAPASSNAKEKDPLPAPKSTHFLLLTY